MSDNGPKEPPTVIMTPPGGGDAAEPTRRGRRWPAWLVLVLVIGVVAAAAVLSGRPEIAIAAAVGLVLAWMVTFLVRLLRRRTLVGVLVILFLALVCAGGSLLYFFTAKGLPTATEPGPGATPVPTPSPGPIVYTGSITVPYRATADLQGDQLVVHERISLDNAVVADIEQVLSRIAKEQVEVDPDSLDLQGWDAGPLVNGATTYERTSTVTADKSSLVSSTLTIPVELGELSLRASDHPSVLSLDPSDDSRLEIAAEKGAIGSTYPIAMTTANDPRTSNSEITSIAIDSSVVDVTVAVLSTPLRNPAGQAVYDAFVWGPLPWLVGAVFAFFTGILGDKIRQWLGFAARRAVRAARKTPQQA